MIFAAAYLLWALQRIIFNRLDDGENETLTDLTPRELAVMAPLLAGILWLGLYPGPVLRRMEPASRHYLAAGGAPGGAGRARRDRSRRSGHDPARPRHAGRASPSP